MGLSAEQIKEREIALRDLEITTYREKHKNKVGYAFISYKSDDWKTVFMDKVIPLQKEGLRVYCDKHFDESNNPWIENMEKNIRHASVFMMFISDRYLTSYATLIELLTAIKFEIPVVPIICDSRSYEEEYVTGFSSYGDLKEDVLLEDNLVKMQPYEAEMLSSLLANRSDNKTIDALLCNINNNYRAKIEGQKFSEEHIVGIFEKILESGLYQKNFFMTDIKKLIGTLKDAVKVWKETGATEMRCRIFENSQVEEKQVVEKYSGRTEEKVNEPQAIVENDVEAIEQEEAIQQETIQKNAPVIEPDIASVYGASANAYALSTLIKDYTIKTFTAKSFQTIGMRIANKPQYTIAPCNSVSSLTKQFMEICLKEQGEAYFYMVNGKNSNKSNPVLIKFADKKKYSVTYTRLESFPEWAMNSNYNPYQFLKELQCRIEEVGIRAEDVEIIFDNPLPEISVSEPETKLQGNVESDKEVTEKQDSVVEPDITSTPIYGSSANAYSLSTLIKDYTIKTFTAKSFQTIGMRIADKPQYTIAPCNSVSSLTKQFVETCLKERGEDYIRMVNKKNSSRSNPVFIKFADKNKYGVAYSRLESFPEWAMNCNYNPYQFLKELQFRIEEVGIRAEDVEIIFDAPLNEM